MVIPLIHPEEYTNYLEEYRKQTNPKLDLLVLII